MKQPPLYSSFLQNICHFSICNLSLWSRQGRPVSRILCIIFVINLTIINTVSSSVMHLQTKDVQTNALDNNPHSTNINLVTISPRIYSMFTSKSFPPKERTNSATMLSKILTVSDLQHVGDGELTPIQENRLIQSNVPTKSDTKFRRKRFACWHSCLGPWKKRTPNTKTDPFKLSGNSDMEQDSDTDHETQKTKSKQTSKNGSAAEEGDSDIKDATDGESSSNGESSTPLEAEGGDENDEKDRKRRDDGDTDDNNQMAGLDNNGNTLDLA